MKKYIAILRGINVSGQKKIRMADLRDLVKNWGFHQVETYIQSGNILFSTKIKEPITIQQTIEKGIHEAYGFEVPVLILSDKEMAYVAENNPFISQGKDPDRLYVTFLSGRPEKDRIDAIDADRYLPEEFVVDGKFLYFFSPLGYGRAKMNNNFFEAKLKLKATTRNWKSVIKLAEMSKDVII